MQRKKLQRLSVDAVVSGDFAGDVAPQPVRSRHIFNLFLKITYDDDDILYSHFKCKRQKEISTIIIHITWAGRSIKENIFIPTILLIIIIAYYSLSNPKTTLHK